MQNFGRGLQTSGYVVSWVVSRIAKKNYHKRHGKPFQNGNLMMLHSPAVPQGHSKKLHCPWSGPYKVVKIEVV